MNCSYQTVLSRCFVNVPWLDLKGKHLDCVLKNRIRPEIGLEGDCLYNESPATFQKISRLLQKHQLDCTLHAPFFDLAPGALDPIILKQSRAKLRLAFDLLDIFRPHSIVCHLQYEDSKQGYQYDRWLETASKTWSELVAIAAARNIPVMLENTYEINPKAHLDILTRLNSPHCRFCLDVGHLLAFSRSDWRNWLPELSPWLGQLHLHDNHGGHDSHLALGQGVFDFQGLFNFLRKNDLTPLVTLEPHNTKWLAPSLAYLADRNFPKPVDGQDIREVH